MIIVHVTLGMNMMGLLIKNQKKCGVEKVYSYQPEPVTRYIRDYTEYWGKSLVKEHDQIFCTSFLEKYCCLSINDIDVERRYSLGDEDIKFIKKYGQDLFDNPDNPDGTLTDHEYFLIHDDLFDIDLATDHNSDIVLNVINTDVSFPSINDNDTDSSSKLINRFAIVSPYNQLQKEGQKEVQYYSQKSIADFRFIFQEGKYIQLIFFLHNFIF